MWRDEQLVRARMTEIEHAADARRHVRGDWLPPDRPRASRVRRMAARVALAAAMALDASSLEGLTKPPPTRRSQSVGP